MKRLMSFATIGALAMGTAVTPEVAAQDFNVQERTFLTFSVPVELPATRLPAGTYLFRIADTPLRNIIQVLTEDEKKVLGQWLYVPAQRQEPSGETVITFGETAAGSAPAIQYWYYPGETIGKEFIYPEDQAMAIAERTGATVMTEGGPVSAGGTAGAAATTGTVEVEDDGPDVDIDVEADDDDAEVEVEVDEAETELEVETDR